MRWVSEGGDERWVSEGGRRETDIGGRETRDGYWKVVGEAQAPDDSTSKVGGGESSKRVRRNLATIMHVQQHEKVTANFQGA